LKESPIAQLWGGEGRMGERLGWKMMKGWERDGEEKGGR
jgi:hypothetical protein